MESNQPHDIYGPERHGRREKDIESDGHEIWDLNLTGGPENPGALEDIIGDGIQEARAHNAIIDESTARTIARTLAHALDGEAPNLDAFASDARIDRIGIEAEYFQLLDFPELPDIVLSWIDWLATYLLYRVHPDGPRPLAVPLSAADVPRQLVRDTSYIDGVELTLHRPAGLLEVGQALMHDRLQELINFYGDSMRAFLTLPDVNAAELELLRQFKELYVGSFEDATDALYGLSDLHEWNAELSEWAEARGLADMVAIDMEQMELRVRDIYDLVELKGRIYAFNR
jgi:hypothetical protein